MKVFDYLRSIERRDEMLAAAAREIAMWQDLTLETTRQLLENAVAWRISQETPEMDLRDDLDAMIQTLRDQVARLEERIVS